MEKAYYTIDAHYMGRGVAVQSPQRVLKRSIKRKAASKVDDASDSFGAYLEYNKVLRTWFVEFGIGGPVLFLVNESLAKRVAAAGTLRCLVLMFLLGAGAK